MNRGPQISLNGNSFWDASLAHDLEFCERQRIPALSVPVRKVEAAGPEQAVEQMAASGTEIVSVIVPGIFDLRDESVWPSQRERLEEMVDVAAAAGAASVYTTTGPAGSMGWEQAAAALQRALPPAAAHAERRGVRLLVEPTSPVYAHLSFVHTLADVAELSRLTGIGIVVDAIAVYGERGLGETIRALAGEIELVQVCDHAPGPRSATNPGGLSADNRAVPGDGEIPLAELLGLILDGGYAGYLDLEIFGPRIAAEGEAAAVGRGIEWIRRFLWDRSEARGGQNGG